MAGGVEQCSSITSFSGRRSNCPKATKPNAHPKEEAAVIREKAARALARQLLEPRVSRVTPLSEEFIDVVARVIMVFVEGDEQKQRAEKLRGEDGPG
jgi:hypothetical protein